MLYLNAAVEMAAVMSVARTTACRLAFISLEKSSFLNCG